MVEQDNYRFSYGNIDGEGEMYRNGKLWYTGSVLRNKDEDWNRKYVDENGAPVADLHWDANRATGHAKYFDNGILRREGDCNLEAHETQIIGKGTQYMDNGQVISVGDITNQSYFNEEMHEYHGDGTLLYSGDATGSKRNGQGKCYHPDGNLRYDGSWKDNIMYGGKSYHENGNLKNKRTFEDGHWEGEISDPDENCVYRGNVHVDGYGSGEVEVYKNGNLFCKGLVKDGMLTKGSIYHNGKRVKGNWSHGKKNGKFEMYYENG
eukprot:970204_1